MKVTDRRGRTHRLNDVAERAELDDKDFRSCCQPKDYDSAGAMSVWMKSLPLNSSVSPRRRASA